MEAKRAAAARAVQLVQNGMTVGLGSGRTANIAIRLLGDMVSAGLRIQAVASSLKSEQLARDCGIFVLDPSDVTVIDLTLDGADQVDVKGNLIKGGGGSLLREKILAFASHRFHVMVDDSKVVQHFGALPLPVEIIRFASDVTLKHIRLINGDPVIRKSGDTPFITDNGNFIADCRFEDITDPAALDVRLKMIPGVVETGLFSSQIVTSIIIGYASGEVREVKVNA